MPIEILMPALSPTMEEGKLAKWLVKEGQKVHAGDVIAEIETDKATMEVEAVDEGTLGRILVEAGTEKVKVNTPIATLLGEGESASAQKAPARPAASPSSARSMDPAEPAQPRGKPAAPQHTASARSADQTAQRVIAPNVGNQTAQPGAGRLFASPLARRLAKEAALDLASIGGTGPHGRIIERDVRQAQKAGAPGKQREDGAAAALSMQALARSTQGSGGPPAGPPATATTAVMPIPDDKIMALYDKGSYEVVPHDGMRRVIAQRLTQSKQTIPHFYLSVDCHLDVLLAARERINGNAPKEGPRAYKLSVNDFVIKALALALQRVPAANATWTEAGMLRHRHSDVGVAVAVQGGLFTPVIRDAELKTLGEISNEMKDLAERARKRRLAPHEYQGGTTSISNLGMFGIKNFDAVINPPHATILAVGAGEKRPVVVGDKLEIATIMSCTLSCDHRVVDGTLGAELINAFRLLIEDPVRMLV